MKVEITKDHHEIWPDGLYLRMVSESKAEDGLLSTIQYALYFSDVICGIGSGPEEDDRTVFDMLLAEETKLTVDARRELGF